MRELETGNQVIFKYCSVSGAIDKSANPNASLNNIAGICNRDRNVFGMMPHPERASEDAMGNTDGLYFFQSLVNKNAFA